MRSAQMARGLSVALAAFALVCLPVHAERAFPPKEIKSLDARTVRELEKRLTLPGGKPLSGYVRYYTRMGDYNTPTPGDGIRGVLLCKGIQEKSPGAYIVPNSQMPIIMDGGCCVIELYFDFQKQDFSRLRCHGIA